MYARQHEPPHPERREPGAPRLRPETRRYVPPPDREGGGGGGGGGRGQRLGGGFDDDPDFHLGHHDHGWRPDYPYAYRPPVWNIGVIMGTVVGVLVGLIVLAIFILVCCRCCCRKKQEGEKVDEETPAYVPQAGVGAYGAAPPATQTYGTGHPTQIYFSRPAATAPPPPPVQV